MFSLWPPQVLYFDRKPDGELQNAGLEATQYQRIDLKTKKEKLNIIDIIIRTKGKEITNQYG